MSADYERKLHGAVAQFVKEADKKYPNWSERNDNGEWEIGLDKFDDMYKVILEIIEYTSCDEATEQMLDDILFGGSGKTPNIKVIFCHKPTEEVEFILNKIKETVTNNGYTFEWIYRPVP